MDAQQIAQLVKNAVQEAIASVYPHKEWLSKKEAANYANCSEQKLDQLIKSGEITAANKGVKGATVSISKSSINSYFKKNIYVPGENQEHLLERVSSDRETARPQNKRRGRTRQTYTHIKTQRLSSNHTGR